MTIAAGATLPLSPPIRVQDGLAAS